MKNIRKIQEKYKKKSLATMAFISCEQNLLLR